MNEETAHALLARLDRIEAQTQPKLSWISAGIGALVINLAVVPYVLHSQKVPALKSTLDRLIAWEIEMANSLGVVTAQALTGRTILKTNQIKIAQYVEQIGRDKDLPRYYMATTALIESTLNPRAQRGGYMSQSARGLFQFIYSTGKSYGLIHGQSDDRLNKELSTRKAAELALANRTILQGAGLPITGENLYLLHNQGPWALMILRIAQGKKVRYPKKLYSNVLNNSGKYKSQIKRFGALTPNAARLFLKYRKETWTKNNTIIKRALS